PARDDVMRSFDAPSALQGRIRVTPVKESRIVNITVEDGDPQRAALLANEVAEAYMLENLALKLRVTETASKWLEDRLNDLEGRAKKSELAVYDFKKDQDVLTTSLEDRANVVSQRLTTYNTALTDVRTRIAGLRARVDAIGELKKLGAGEGNHWAEALPWVDNTFIQNLKLRFANQRTECAELAERYLEAHPKLAICKEKLALAEKDLLGELNNAVKAAQTELAEATAKETNLVRLLDQTKTEAFAVNKKQIEYERLKRDADNDQRLYDLVLKRLKDIELSGLLRTSNVRILDAARPSFGPVRPNLNRSVTMAMAVGLLLGVALVLLLEFGDQRLRTQREVEDLGMPFLGLIPALSPEQEASPNRDLHVHEQPKSMMAESCRAVRTNLLFMSPDKAIRTMVITSSSPQEGKSMTVLCLGTTIAQSGKKVLLLDTDMRRPRLHRALGVPNDVGVSSLVVGAATLDQAVKTTEVPNLFILPCGPIPPNPSELLHTRAFADLLEAAKEKYDWVILDSPPINAVTDAVVLATLVDGVVLVVKAGVTPKGLAAQALRSLRDVNAKVFGAVLNAVDFDDPKFGGHYSAYHRYGYYYGEKNDEAA
ncbi:MAG TPA: polysaccharide biosynthesis tyrosine autokinase, partial [Myxococcaceae bacterium]|nr:polysaccharide biosynthesis tyrosine autokinase [Myxococcaceae bacterium]